MRPYVDDVDMDVLGTEFGIGLDVIQRYLAREPPVEREYDGYSQQWQDFFADQFDQEITSSITERWFENPGLGGKGKVDLIQSPTTLLDYKSGRSGSAAKIVRILRSTMSATNPTSSASVSRESPACHAR